MSTKLYATLLAIAVVLTPAARADLIDAFSGFDAIWETGVSGLQSSYYADTRTGQSVTGPTTGSFLHDLGPARVSYPSGIGEVPSPGGSVGRHFDQGVLGLQLEGDRLLVKLATGLNPLEGYYYDGWDTWYGQGDLFVTVQDSNGIRHHGLLSAWARDSGGQARSLNGGHFDDAQAFHTSGGAGGSSLEGHLVQLHADGDVTLSGGIGSYQAGNAPAGLDMRAFAEGGTDLGDAGLSHDSLSDLGQTWYLQTWSLDLNLLSSDTEFGIGLHASVSCGNDQMGGVYTVPEPGAAVLSLLGFGYFARVRRRLL